MKWRAIVALAATPILVAALPATSEELVLNGGFEAPVVSTSQGWDIYPSGTAGLGWTVEWTGAVPDTYLGCSKPNPANLELHKGNLAGSGPYTGLQKAELDTDWDGPAGNKSCKPLNGEPGSVRIYQDLPTCPGETYTLSYAWRPRGDTSATSRMEVWWDGGYLNAHHGNNSTNNSWHLVTETLVASSQITRLMFEETGIADSYGMFLDGVSVTGPYCPPCTTELIADGGEPVTEVQMGYVAVFKNPSEWPDDAPDTCQNDEFGYDWLVVYQALGSWELREIHFDFDCDLSGIPTSKKGSPKIGHFDYRFENLDDGRYLFCVPPLEGCLEDCGVYAAHAWVVDPEDVTSLAVKSGEAATTVTRRRAGNGPTPFEDQTANYAAVAAWEPCTSYPNCPDNKPETTPPDYPDPSLWDNRISTDPDGARLLALGADWIWETKYVADPIQGTAIRLETSFEIPGPLAEDVISYLRITCDNGYEAYVNGTAVGNDNVYGDWRNSSFKQAFVDVNGWDSVMGYDVSGLLQMGENVLRIDAANEYFNTDDAGNGTPGNMQNNPGACIFVLETAYIREETAWGNGTPFTDADWSMWFECGEECPVDD